MRSKAMIYDEFRVSMTGDLNVFGTRSLHGLYIVANDRILVEKHENKCGTAFYEVQSVE